MDARFQLKNGSHKKWTKGSIQGLRY